MPTGYTSKLYDGKEQTFQQFVMECARAFGALVTMRDDAMDAPIPEKFEPSPFYSRELSQKTTELEQIRAWDTKRADREAQRHYDEATAHWNEARIEREARRQRYQAMLDNVRAWKPPTADHRGLADFMSQQLTASIKWDCEGDYYRTPPKRLDGATFKAQRIAELSRAVTYATQSLQQEESRVKARNRWLRELRESLKA